VTPYPNTRFRRWFLPTELPELPLSAGRDALFVRLVGLLYVLAFASLWPQIPGLFGEHGILPAQLVLDSISKELGGRRFYLVPTLFWFRATDTALLYVCGAGLLAGLSVLALRLVWPALFLAWFCHLSFLWIGGPFLSFQWDLLLSELGVLLLLSVPVRYQTPQPLKLIPVGYVLLLWLLFRVVFGAGYLKLAGGDATWRDLTAVHHHLETQPLPTVFAFYAHALPFVVKKALSAATLVVEAVVPFLLFVPRLHRVALALFVGLHVGIALCGNYGYFNVQVLVLSLLLAPVAWFAFLRPNPVAAPAGEDGEADAPSQVSRRPSFLYGVVRLAFALLVFAASLGHFLWTLREKNDVPALLRVPMKLCAPVQAVSHYGPFASMTTARPELVIEGSQDGVTWREYSFPWKPGDPKRRPRWNAPYQPRLDWQMWFAALAKPSDSPWLHMLLLRLLEGSQDVLWLFESDPFAGRRPNYLRVQLYPYRFTQPAEQRQTGAYFVRDTPLPFISPVGLTTADP